MGDSPLVAAGTWADDATAAISCTGDGEAIIRVALAHEIDALMRHAGLPLAEACDRALAGLEHLGTAGLIAVGADGDRHPVHDPRDAARLADRRRPDRAWRSMTDVDHLYALPLEEFTPARDAAAKEIRKAGDRETAAIVAKLPKPTPAAWTANQVAREQPELIEAMLEAGEDLRVAQEAAVSGGGGRGLRDATLAERRAVDAVMTAAMDYKPAGKPLSRAMADRLRTTLHAAASDEAIRDALAQGRLFDEAQAGGAWPFALEPVRSRTARAGEGQEEARGPQAEARGKKEDTAERERRRPRRGRRQSARRPSARRARRSRPSCARRAPRCGCASGCSPARGGRGGREDAVSQAKAALEQAQKAVEDALAEAEAAQQVLEQAREALDQARDTVARLEERLD